MAKGIYLLLLLFICTHLLANPIDEGTAKKVAINFFNIKGGNNAINNSSDISLAYQSINTNSALLPTKCFYVFNTINSKGFVIIAADDIVKPILGYSDETNFDTTNIPLQLSEWLADYTQQIASAILSNTKASDETKASWQSLLNPQPRTKTETFGIGISTLGIPIISPLLKTSWNQNPYYNNLCPYDNSGKQLTVTGCVATAMAQVMKFWNYPTKGIGFRSYTPKTNPQYGLLSANFGTTTYQWASMPTALSSGSTTAQLTAVATLMYHCGVSVSMDYGTAGAGGSQAYTTGGILYQSADYALKTYFGYDATLQAIQRSNLTTQKWIDTIQKEIKAGRPVIYRGTGSGGGHCFIADGYDNNNYFHFNWGWGGSNNGYFEVDSLNPAGIGVGGGTGGYNSNQAAIIGIKPATTITYSIGVNASVTSSANSVNYGTAFTVSTSLINTGANSFTGDYCAAVFDSTNKFIDYVEIKSGQTLAAGKSQTLTFSSTGMYQATPGSYIIATYYRTTGGNWVLVSNNGTFSNYLRLTVINPTKNIVLSSALSTSPTTLTSGNGATFNVNIKNNQVATKFLGKYKVNLYNLNGTVAQTIGTYTESKGLAANSSYASPLSFITASISVSSGSYILAVLDSANGSGAWEFTGIGSYKNPIQINILDNPLSADKYEANDSINQCYSLAANFVNNSATIITGGANINTGKDNDFYKLILPKGYSYSAKAVLNNANYTGDSTYTLDGIFSYSKDSITWSSTFKDSSIFTATGGQTLYFHIAAGSQGKTGTYLLTIKLARTSPIITGSVITPIGTTVTGIAIHARSSYFDTTFKSANAFSVKLIGGDDTISLQKNNDLTKTNGLTVLDALLVQQHINGKQLLNSPYKIIAADVDNSGSVNATDVALIKRLVLGIDTTFTGNRLWAFVCSDFKFIPPTNPFPYSSYYTFPNTTSNTTKNFIGIKLGDVNYDWNVAIAGTTAGVAKPITLFYADIHTTTNETTIRLPIRVKDFKNIHALQYSLRFNSSTLRFKTVTNNLLNVDFATNKADKGLLSFLWNEENESFKTLPDSTILMELIFDKQAPITNEDISIAPDNLPTEAWDSSLMLHGIIKGSGSIKGEQLIAKESWQISPNPSTGIITINLQTKDAKEVLLQLTSIDGRRLYSQKVTTIRGSTSQTINLNKSSRLAAGIYYIKAIGLEEGINTKQILIK